MNRRLVAVVAVWAQSRGNSRRRDLFRESFENCFASVDIFGRIKSVAETNELKQGAETMTRIDHATYQKRTRKMSRDALNYTIKDCQEAIAAMPNGEKAGYYADEINYCAMEINRRNQRNR